MPKAAELGLRRRLAGAEVDAAARDEVERRDALGHPRRMVERRRHLHDAVAEPDARGPLRDRRQEDLGRARVAVLLEEVVLDLPDVVDPEPVGERALLERLLEHAVLGVGDPRGAAAGARRRRRTSSAADRRRGHRHGAKVYVPACDDGKNRDPPRRRARHGRRPGRRTSALRDAGGPGTCAGCRAAAGRRCRRGPAGAPRSRVRDPQGHDARPRRPVQPVGRCPATIPVEQRRPAVALEAPPQPPHMPQRHPQNRRRLAHRQPPGCHPRQRVPPLPLPLGHLHAPFCPRRGVDRIADALRRTESLSDDRSEGRYLTAEAVGCDACSRGGTHSERIPEVV